MNKKNVLALLLITCVCFSMTACGEPKVLLKITNGNAMISGNMTHEDACKMVDKIYGKSDK